MPSTNTIQQVVDFASANAELMPLANVGGYNSEPALSLANDTLQELLANEIPWKCNRKEMPTFVVQRNKQDYLFAGAVAFELGGDALAVGIDLASNNAITESSFTVTVNTLEPHSFSVGDTIYMSGNTIAAYNSTFTINPNSAAWSGGWTITATPTTTSFQFTHSQSGLGTSGAPGITDCASLEACTMVDPRSATSPQPTRVVQVVRMLEVASLSAIPEQVCMVSDLGTGVIKLRVHPLPGPTPWMVSLVYQAKAPIKRALTDTWAPFPDEYAFVYRQLFLAHCLRYVNSPRADVEFQKAQAAIAKALGKEDREQSEEFIVPYSPIDTGFGGMNTGWWWL